MADGARAPQIQSRGGCLQWRFREHLARQMPVLSQLFSVAATYSVVVPLLFDLLSDPVAAVRESCYEARIAPGAHTQAFG